VLSVAVSECENSTEVFDLLEAGAVDVYAKPRHGLMDSDEVAAQELIRKIRVIAGVKVVTRKPTPPLSSKPPTPRTTASKIVSSLPEAIAVGASTGGPQALLSLFSALPGDFPIPILAVQHINQGFTDNFVQWLNAHCALSVQLAREGEKMHAPGIFFPPDGHHLCLDHRRDFRLIKGDVRELHCPSVTVLFNNLAEVLGRHALGILMTGMGNDGAEGLLKIREAGGETIAQSEESCVVFGMPKQAIYLNAAAHVMDLADIASFLKNIR
jgi:two-component system chemotaxis response regulator CheB